MKRFTEGEIVEPFDGSYVLGIDSDGSLNHKIHGFNLVNRHFEVLASKCDLPSCDRNFPEERNDLILRALDNRQIIFIKSDQCKPVHQCSICPSCGEKIIKEV